LGPIPNPQSPIPNPQSPFKYLIFVENSKNYFIRIYIKKIYIIL